MLALYIVPELDCFMLAGTLLCTFCRTEVEEDKEAHHEENSRVSQASKRFRLHYLFCKFDELRQSGR